MEAAQIINLTPPTTRWITIVKHNPDCDQETCQVATHTWRVRDDLPLSLLADLYAFHQQVQQHGIDALQTPENVLVLINAMTDIFRQSYPTMTDRELLCHFSAADLLPLVNVFLLQREPSGTAQMTPPTSLPTARTRKAKP